MKNKLWIVVIILLASALSYAGGKYTGQIRVDMIQAGHSTATIDSVLDLPAIDPGSYKLTTEDYESTVTIRVNDDGTFSFKRWYPLEDK